MPHRELDRARAADRFVDSATEGDYPVYGGKNIHQFLYDDSLAVPTAPKPPALWSVDGSKNPDKSAKRRVRERTFNSGELKRALYTAFDGEDTSKSQKRFVNDLLEEHRGTPLQMKDSLLDCTEYRVAYREIANARNERTMTAAVLPKDVVCHHKVHTIRPYEIAPNKSDLTEVLLHSVYKRVFSDQELFVLLGLLNSLPFDSLMRTKLDNSIAQYKFKESQMPRLTDGDDWFYYISARAARLNCYGDAFAEMRERLGGLDPATEPDERRRLRAEIDAAAFHAYGLDREETIFVLDDFHRVQSPRLMTESYFERVSEQYDTLTEAGPHE